MRSYAAHLARKARRGAAAFNAGKKDRARIDADNHAFAEATGRAKMPLNSQKQSMRLESARVGSNLGTLGKNHRKGIMRVR